MPGWVKDIIGSGALYENDGGDWYAPATDLWTQPPFNLTAATTPFILSPSSSGGSSSAAKTIINNHYEINVPVAADRYDIIRELRKLNAEFNLLMGN